MSSLSSQVPRSRRGGFRGNVFPRLVAAAWLAGMLPGCPLSDEYFVDPQAGFPVSGSGTGGTTAAMGGTAGVPTMGGSSAVGGSASGVGGTGGSAGATTEAGRGGSTAASGGMGATSGADSSGGAPDAGMTGEGGNGAGGETGCVSGTERCDGIDNDCDGDIDEGSVCPDSCVAKQKNGQLYVLCVSTDSNDAIGAEDASQLCGDIGTELGLELPLGLAWIDSSDENTLLKDWILATAPAGAAIWIGATDQKQENQWVWGRRTGAEQFFTGDSDGGGAPYMGRFNDFGPGQPDGGDSQDCGAFDSSLDGHWNDLDCASEQVGFVCDEHPPF